MRVKANAGSGPARMAAGQASSQGEMIKNSTSHKRLTIAHDIDRFLPPTVRFSTLDSHRWKLNRR